MDKRRHRVKWGAGQERSRTGADYWKKPLRWDRAAFLECVGCGWRGDENTLAGVTRHCPRCDKWAFRPVRRRVFCASLADVFDNEVPPSWRADLFSLIRQTPNLDWLLLTKRIGNAERMITEAGGWSGITATSSRNPMPNVWLGATVVNQDEAGRDVPKLLQTPAAVRFLSIEPMLGPIDLTVDGLVCLPCRNADNMRMDPTTGAYECCRRCDYTGIGDEWGVDWVICGGESGPDARPMHPEWVRSLRDQCAAAGVAFLFKQWGEWAPYGRGQTDSKLFVNPSTEDTPLQRFGKKLSGRQLDGRLHDQFPEIA
jgi:protein gp37